MIILIPYRKREEHLKIFVPHMKNFLPDAKIFVIEQADDKDFNRGKLLNIGVIENPDEDYYIMHDVDMLPISADYSHPKRPTHIATEVEQFDFKMPYQEYFGGVTLFTEAQFRFINGFTNEIYGWGMEDDILRRDLHWRGIKIDRRKGRFTSLPHEVSSHDTPEYKSNEVKFKKGRKADDGLNGCKYEVVSREKKDGFDLLKVLL